MPYYIKKSIIDDLARSYGDGTIIDGVAYYDLDDVCESKYNTSFEGITFTGFLSNGSSKEYTPPSVSGAPTLPDNFTNNGSSYNISLKGYKPTEGHFSKAITSPGTYTMSRTDTALTIAGSTYGASSFYDNAIPRYIFVICQGAGGGGGGAYGDSAKNGAGGGGGGMQCGVLKLENGITYTITVGSGGSGGTGGASGTNGSGGGNTFIKAYGTTIISANGGSGGAKHGGSGGSGGGGSISSTYFTLADLQKGASGGNAKASGSSSSAKNFKLSSRTAEQNSTFIYSISAHSGGGNSGLGGGGGASCMGNGGAGGTAGNDGSAGGTGAGGGGGAYVWLDGKAGGAGGSGRIVFHY